jgi:Protein of unknown function (DUF3072)
MNQSKDADHATPGDNRKRDPEDWVTGDESMTGAQRSYLETLCRSSTPLSPKQKLRNASKSFRGRRAAVGIIDPSSEDYHAISENTARGISPRSSVCRPGSWNRSCRRQTVEKVAPVNPFLRRGGWESETENFTC